MFAYLLRTHRGCYRADTGLGTQILNETLTVTAYVELSRINSLTRKIDKIALLTSDEGIFEGGNGKW